MKELIIFVSVLLLLGLLVGWFRFAEYLQEIDAVSTTVGFWLALGVPCATVAVVIFHFATTIN